MDTNLTLLKVDEKFKNADIIWKYTNFTWSAHSQNSTLLKTLQNSNIAQITNINTHEGFWIYNRTDENISFDTDSSSELQSCAQESTLEEFALCIEKFIPLTDSNIYVVPDSATLSAFYDAVTSMLEGSCEFTPR